VPLTPSPSSMRGPRRRSISACTKSPSAAHTAPPMMSEAPEMNFVRLCTTTSAPSLQQRGQRLTAGQGQGGADGVGVWRCEAEGIAKN
jgi:hypothetical protein